MAKPVTHLSRIRTFGDRTITGTRCNRMTGHSDINCTTDFAEVSCKLCIKNEQLYGVAATAKLLGKLNSTFTA